MGRVARPKTLKEPPVMEVKALARSPDMNRSLEIYLTLGRYQEDIPSIDFVQPRD
jgi:hypothetical protein